MSKHAKTTGSVDQEKNNLNKLIRDFYFNMDQRKKYKNFSEILKENLVPNSVELHSKLKNIVELSIKDTVDQLSDIQYHIMEKTNHWGEYGKQRVVIGYARLKLNIAPDAEISQSDIDRFMLIMNKNTDLKTLTVEQLKEMDETQFYDILGKKIKIHRSDLVNRELRFLDSAFRISVGKYGEYRSMLYGQGKNMRKEGYDLILYEKELSRTPTNIMSIAAVIGSYDIGIRKEACNLIYAMKWKKMFEYTEHEKQCMYNNEAGNIREMIKVRALDAYKIKSLDDINEKRALFIDEMVEGILWHEFGHGVFFNDELEVEDSAKGKAFNFFGENIVGILHEVLADWAPRKGKLKGPIQHFLEVAKKDPDKANRMLLVYMSDNWFLDFKEEFLGTQTDLMISVLMPFIDQTARFDFVKLQTKYAEIYSFMLKKSKDVIDGVIDIMQRTSYKLLNDVEPFSYIEKEVYRILNKTRDNISEEAMSYRAAFWSNVFALCKSFSPVAYREVLGFIKSREKQISKELLLMIEPTALTYNGNIRDYLFDQMKSKGFIKEVKPLLAMDAILMALDQIGVFEIEKEKIINNFKAIVSGEESKSISVNYDASFNFFNCAIQEMLLSTQLGEIDREHFVLNDKVVIMHNGQTSNKVNSDTIVEKIGELAKMFDDRSILSISMLKVNTLHEGIDVWYKYLAEKVLADGSLLIQKIDYVTGEHMENNLILKYRVPVEYGYMCFNTVNAIEKINDLLKDNGADKNIIDKSFLNFVTFEYNNTY